MCSIEMFDNKLRKYESIKLVLPFSFFTGSIFLKSLMILGITAILFESCDSVDY